MDIFTYKRHIEGDGTETTKVTIDPIAGAIIMCLVLIVAILL